MDLVAQTLGDLGRRLLHEGDQFFLDPLHGKPRDRSREPHPGDHPMGVIFHRCCDAPDSLFQFLVVHGVAEPGHFFQMGDQFV